MTFMILYKTSSDMFYDLNQRAEEDYRERRSWMKRASEGMRVTEQLATLVPILKQAIEQCDEVLHCARELTQEKERLILKCDSLETTVDALLEQSETRYDAAVTRLEQKFHDLERKVAMIG